MIWLFSLPSPLLGLPIRTKSCFRSISQNRFCHDYSSFRVSLSLKKERWSIRENKKWLLLFWFLMMDLLFWINLLRGRVITRVTKWWNPLSCTAVIVLGSDSKKSALPALYVGALFEFVFGSERFFSGYSGFPLSTLWREYCIAARRYKVSLRVF